MTVPEPAITSEEAAWITNASSLLRRHPVLDSPGRHQILKDLYNAGRAAGAGAERDNWQGAHELAGREYQRGLTDGAAAERERIRIPAKLDPDDYRRLCLKAFEALPSGTTVMMSDVDAILTWCLPALADLLTDLEAQP